MSKPNRQLSNYEQLRLEDKAKAMTHTALIHTAFMKLVNDSFKSETSN